VRESNDAVPETQTMIAQVWPEKAPDMKDKKAFYLDGEAAMPTHFEVTAGSTFYVVSDESKHFPNGFAWAEPTYAFKCVEVVSQNVGDYKSGWRVWEMKAKTELCKEEFFLKRPENWPADILPKQALINVNVIGNTCAAPCEIGQRYSSAVTCDCIDVVVKPVVGQLFEAHKFAAFAHVRVILDMNSADTSGVTLRQWSVNGAFPYNVDFDTMKLDCVEKAKDGIKNDYYQEQSLKAFKDNCRWTIELHGETADKKT
jgi:hypothetical protein